MSKNNDFKLDILSQIKEELIDKATATRIERRAALRAKAARMRRRTISVIAAAACFCIVLSALLITLLGGKEVPVYTGMTVSSTAPVVSADADGIFDIFSLDNSIYRTLDNSNKTPNVEGNNGNHNGQNKHTDKMTEETWNTNASGKEPIFYANANANVYITVHFDNPDAFEILSFVLNGQKYTSYMFEEGSTLENIVVKVNTGNTAGLVEYTIDAIKYVDGTEIKDVKIGGDQTIAIGVYNAALQPAPAVSAEVISYNDVSFDVLVTDSFDLIGKSNGELYAALYKGEELISKQPLRLEETLRVSFEGLATGGAYRYEIVGAYDAYDKQGIAEHILYSKEFTTKTVLSFTEVDANQESISFALLWDEAFEDKTLVSLALYKGEEKICDIDPANMSAHGLLSGVEYILVAEYMNKEALEKAEYKVTTKTKELPTVSASSVEVPELTSLKFEAGITDVDQTGRIKSIELLCDGELHGTVDKLEDTVLFEGLEPLHVYVLRIVYAYDLNDGAGEQTLIAVSDEVNLQSKGLDVLDGEIRGIGSCADTELYLNMPITNIAFNENTQIKKVYLGKNVTDICDNAFSGCTGLTEVYISEGISRIPWGVFYGCESLVKVNIPESVTSIGDDAFGKCYSLSQIVIPDNVTSIGAQAFFECKSLAEITIPESVTSIGYKAFCECYGLTQIAIPNSVTSIGYNAFLNCSGLEIANIPTSINEIPEGMFCGCRSLSQITIPENITSIGKNAFTNCESLIQIVIPESVTSIGAEAFAYCRKLETVNIPTGIKEIPDGMFLACNLRAIAIPQGVTLIGTRAFYLNPLEELIIPEGVTTIKDEAFCMGKVTSLILPKTLTSVSTSAFASVNSSNGAVVKIYVSELDTWLKNDIVIDHGWNDRDELEDSLWSIVHYFELYLNGEKVTEITIPSDITYIRDYAFLNCVDLAAITIHGGVTSIGKYAFRGCESLKSITLPSSVTSIGADAFENCEILESVTLLGNVSVVDENTFKGCSNLRDVYLPSSITRIRAGAFVDCGSALTLHFDGTKEQWNKMIFIDGWKDGIAITVRCTDGDISCD